MRIPEMTLKILERRNLHIKLPSCKILNNYFYLPPHRVVGFQTATKLYILTELFMCVRVLRILLFIFTPKNPILQPNFSSSFACR